MAAGIPIDRTSVLVAPPDAAPFDPDTVVEEQDTALVLDIDPIIRESGEEYPELVSNMVDQEPLVPGDVIVRKGRPLRFLAIVHDLDNDPSCDTGTVAVALENLLREFNRRRVHSAAMPLLGTVHGRFGDETFLTLLYNALQQEPQRFLEELWLIVPAADCERITRHIERYAHSASPE